MKIYHKGTYQYWYDRGTRAWWFAQFDKHGNQIGDADHAYTKGEVEDRIEELIMEFLREVSK